MAAIAGGGKDKVLSILERRGEERREKGRKE